MDREKNHIRAVISRDGAALLDTRRGTISTLNPTGAYIWRALQQGLTETAISVELARETGSHIETVLADVSQFIAALKKEKLLP